MEDKEDMLKRMQEALGKAFGKTDAPRPDEAKMDNFYVYGCPVMILEDTMARIDAPSPEHASKVQAYLVSEGFLPEAKDEQESWK